MLAAAEPTTFAMTYSKVCKKHYLAIIHTSLHQKMYIYNALLKNNICRNNKLREASARSAKIFFKYNPGRRFTKGIRMPEDVLTKIMLPLGLALIMFTLGCGLRLQDFKRVFLFPKAISVGLLCQFVALPLVAFALITAFNVSGAMAVGFMLIAACPTGPTSNLLAYHARADVALSLTFTAVSSIASIL